MKLYTPNEAAAYLRIGRALLYRLMNRGKIDYVMVEERRRIKESALKRYLGE